MILRKPPLIELLYDKTKVTLEFDNRCRKEVIDKVPTIIDPKAEYDFLIEKRRKKRSLDANAYFHVLVGKIAEALTISKAKSKNILICKYGQPELMEDGNFLFYKTNAPEEYMAELETIHAIPVKYEENATYYKVYRGSRTYNSKEMSLLIDGTVADAKELGIETMTPDELERMKSTWRKNNVDA